MALSRALAVLSLLPLLAAQSPKCGNLNLTATPITNTTLDQLSGKWFYIASAFRNPEFNQSARTIQAAFFYFHINSTEDTILLREYLTIGNQCVYNVSSLDVHRENGSLSKHEFGKEQFGYFLQTKDPKTFMLAFSPKDEQNMGLSFYTDKAQATQEQMREFHEAITCMGMQKSEIVYTDEKQNACGPLEKQHKEEKEKQKESEGSSDDTALG